MAVVSCPSVQVWLSSSENVPPYLRSMGGSTHVTRVVVSSCSPPHATISVKDQSPK